MPELVIQTLCTFRCNHPFQEALWHDMHGIPPPQKKKHTQTLFCLPIILPFLFPLFFSMILPFPHCFSYPSFCFSSNCFVYPSLSMKTLTRNENTEYHGGGYKTCANKYLDMDLLWPKHSAIICKIYQATWAHKIHIDSKSRTSELLLATWQLRPTPPGAPSGRTSRQSSSSRGSEIAPAPSGSWAKHQERSLRWWNRWGLTACSEGCRERRNAPSVNSDLPKVRNGKGSIWSHQDAAEGMRLHINSSKSSWTEEMNRNQQSKKCTALSWLHGCHVLSCRVDRCRPRRLPWHAPRPGRLPRRELMTRKRLRSREHLKEMRKLVSTHWKSVSFHHQSFRKLKFATKELEARLRQWQCKSRCNPNPKMHLSTQQPI